MIATQSTRRTSTGRWIVGGLGAWQLTTVVVWTLLATVSTKSSTFAGAENTENIAEGSELY